MYSVPRYLIGTQILSYSALFLPYFGTYPSQSTPAWAYFVLPDYLPINLLKSLNPLIPTFLLLYKANCPSLSLLPPRSF